MTEKADIVLNFSDQNAKVLRDADRGLGNLGNTAKRIGTTLKNALLPAAAALGALTFASKKCLDAFGEQEKSVVTLNQAMKNAGNYTKSASRDLQNYASQLQRVTVYGDETTLKAMSLIASFGYEGETLKQLTKATQDLAAAKGMDLVAAADLVSKTVGSSTNALARYGLQVEGAANSTERAQAAVNSIATLFGGQAQAQAMTYTGAITQMKNALGDVMETIGAELAPVVGDFARLIANNADKIDAFVRTVINGFKKIFNVFTHFGEIASNFSSIWDGVITYITSRVNDFLELTTSFADVLANFTSTGELVKSVVTGRLMETVENARISFDEFKMAGEESFELLSESINTSMENINQIISSKGMERLGIQKRQNTIDLKEDMDKKKKQIEAEKFLADAKINISKNTSNVFSDLFTLMGEKYNTLFEIGRAAAAGQVVYDTARATIAAVASMAGAGPVGWVLGGIKAASIATAGGVALAKIYAAHMEYGGLIPGTPYGTPIIAGEKNKPEIITPLDPESREKAGIGGGDNYFNINFNGPILTNELPDIVVSAIDEGLEKKRRNQSSLFVAGMETQLAMS